jgi:site-specific recombinase XerD
MGKLRDLMDRDLQIRGYSAGTRYQYLSCVTAYVRHFMKPPDQLTLEHVNQYQLHLTQDRKVDWKTFNVHVCAVRFFYKVTLRRDWDMQRIPYQKSRRQLPEVLSTQEVKALLETPSNIKHRAVLATLYAGGLRASEVTHLRIQDIDSQRMLMRIEQGKGGKDRYVPLSTRLLAMLREYWKGERPQTWLFPGRDPQKPLSRECLSEICVRARKAAGILKPAHPHTLRHSFATHLLESGVNILVVKKLLGHRSLRTTEIYLHVAKTYLEDTPSPLDLLPDLRNAQVAGKG